MKDEELKLNTTIYNGAVNDNDPERERQRRAEQRQRRALLPKFMLAEGETFYVARETIQKLNIEYFEMLDEMRSGLNFTFEDLESYMRSVIIECYKSEIEKLQRDGEQKAATLKKIEQYKNRRLATGYVKDHWWSRKAYPNKPLEQLMKLGEIEAAMELAARDEEIERQSKFITGPREPSEEFFDLLLKEFVSERKQNRLIRKRGKYILWLLTTETSVEKLYNSLITELAPEKKRRKKFEEQNGEYLKVLIEAYLSEDEAEDEPTTEPEGGQPAEGTEEATAEPTEEAETEYDDLSALYELADEEDETPAVVEEEPSPEPMQGQIELAITSETVEPVQEFIPQTADEPADNGNADGENGNE